MAGELTCSTSAAFSTSLLPSTAIQSRARSTGRQPPNQLIHSSSADAPISRVPQQPTLPSRSQPQTPSASPMNKDLQQIREDMRKSDHSTREELRRMNGLLCNVLDEMKKFSASFQETKEKNFTIEDSVYKKDLVGEMGILFCKSLLRRPSKADVQDAIMRILKEEGRSKYKFAKALVFCNAILTSLRAEERRRVLGIRPCEKFVSLRTEDFVEKFLPILKVEDQAVINEYKRHTALLRVYLRESPLEEEDKMLPSFKKWLEARYDRGMPTESDMEAVYQEDHLHDYSSNGHGTLIPQVPDEEPNDSDYENPDAMVS